MTTTTALKLHWDSTRAEQEFEVGSDICGSMMEKITLPSFCSWDDKDLTWTIELQRRTGTQYDGTDVTSWNVQLMFSSASMRETVFASVSLVGRQIYVPHTTISKKFICNIPFSSVWPETHLGILHFARRPENGFSFRIRVDVSDGTMRVTNPPPPLPAFERALPPDCLPRSLGTLLDSGMLADVVLCVGGAEVPAHRCILAARSDVFRAMFEADMKERAAGKVDIKDVRLPVMMQLLRYMYTGAVDPEASPDTDPPSDGTPAASDTEEDNVSLVDLLVAADRFMVTQLRDECERRLAEELLRCCQDPVKDAKDSKFSVRLVEVLLAGHHLDCKPLRRVGLRHLKQHRKLVIGSRQWKEFVEQHRSVAADVLLCALSLDDEAARDA